LDLPPGAKVGTYTIEAVAALGGFGSVYRAADPSGQPVALKVLHASYAAFPNILGRFRREVEVVQRSRHPGIVDVLALGELPDGRPFIAMEWLDGQTVTQIARAAGTLDLDFALWIAEELCSALALVHAAGVVHRDLKGSNVMIIESGGRKRVKLLDFGIAKPLDQHTKLTHTGAQIGTPGHMAPEQLLGRLVGPPTDIYALGLLLFKLLTNRNPFDARTMGELELMHLSAPPSRASEVAGVPEAVSEVIARCLSKKPNARYASVEELLEELREAAAAPAGTAAPLRAMTKPAAAIFLTVEGEERVDLCSAESQRVCEAEGLTIAYEEEDREPTPRRAMLAVMTLPRGEASSRAVRARVLRLADRLSRPREPAVRCAAAVHAAPAVMLLVEGARQFTGGDLFNFEAWAAGAAPGTVLATAEALEGLDEVLAAEPMSRRVQYRPRIPGDTSPPSSVPLPWLSGLGD
jgi:serine/threonine-protein kinase